GLKYLDPTRAVIASCLEPVFAVVFAAVFVGEGVNVLQVVGILAVLAATVMAQAGGAKPLPEADWKNKAALADRPKLARPGCTCLLVERRMVDPLQPGKSGNRGAGRYGSWRQVGGREPGRREPAAETFVEHNVTRRGFDVFDVVLDAPAYDGQG